MRYSSKHPSFWVKRHLANKLTYRAPRVARGVEPTLHITKAQMNALKAVVETYLPDLHDPAAVEVLLVLLEVLHILAVSEYRLGQLFGAHRHALETWGDIVPPKQRPAQLQRAWVWVPNTHSPKLYPIAQDGTIRIYPARETSKEQAAK
jgi:hypothetical protein